MNADEETDEICLNFLNQFIINSEAAFLDSIDIILMLKAIPLLITKH